MKDKPSEYIRLIQEDPSLVQVTNGVEDLIFHRAAECGRLQVMEAINNIDPHMKDRGVDYFMTPLMFAASQHDDQVASVKWLLDHDVDVNKKNSYGQTALDLARSQKIEDMIKKK